MSIRRAGCGIFIPFLVLALALGGWGAWWMVLSSRLKDGLDQQAATLRAAGWSVAYQDVRTDGWPFRMRLSARDVEILAPSGHGLAAPVLQAEAMAYQLGRWVALAPDGLRLGRGTKGWVEVSGQALRASVSSLDRTPPRVVVEFDQARFNPAEGAEPFPIASARRLILNLVPGSGESRQAGLLLDLQGAAPRPGGALADMSQDRPFDLRAEAMVEEAFRLDGAAWGPALRHWAEGGGSLSAIRVEATADDDRLRGESDRLTPDADGRLVGALDLSMRGGTAPLAGLARAPGVDPTAAAAVRLGVQATSGLRGESRLTLRFSDGRTFVGPIALGPAPRVF